MPEPLKNMVDRAALERIAARFVAVTPGFPATAFVDDLTEQLDNLELKDRIAAIAARLRLDLPPSFPDALDVVVAASQQTEPEPREFDAWPLCTFVELYGGEHTDASLDAMERLTVAFSCEFAIRPFLRDHAETTFHRLESWVTHPHESVRRLVSEGTRPRLPWGMRVPALIEDPRPGLHLIDRLYRDESPVVRRSVANHLNDVAMDHPDLAVGTARRFAENGTVETDALVKHALRTLVKNGDPEALEILGFTTEPGVEIESFTCNPGAITLGESVELEASLRSTSPVRQKLVIDYVVHHVKANGATTPKVFKWVLANLDPGESRSLRKVHAVREITTRRYHPGRHRVEIMIAGTAMARAEFDLRIP